MREGFISNSCEKQWSNSSNVYVTWSDKKGVKILKFEVLYIFLWI